MLTNIITSDFTDLHEAAIDEIIRGLGVNCRLIYKGSKWEPCPNCYVNPQTGKSTGTYKTGGPISFSTGVCPYCKSHGRVTTDTSEDIQMAVIWDQKQFMNTVVPVDGNQVQTIVQVEYFHQLKKATQIIIDTSLSDYSSNVFQRVGDPSFAGFTHKFVFLNWKRVN